MNSSSETINSGQRANRTGNKLEKFIENVLKESGYTEFIGNKRQAFENRKSIGGKQYIKQLVVGPTIYDSERKVDFMIFNKEKFPDGLIIESKWQQSSGSVDEKYPFLFFNIMKTEVPTIVLLDGGGYKPTAMKWLKGQVNLQGALIGVWNMVEFQKEVNDGFLG